MSFGSFVRWTLGTAVATPLAPFAFVYACTRDQFGWGELALFGGGLIASAVLVALILLAMVNPIAAGTVYGIWCLGVGLKMGMN